MGCTHPLIFVNYGINPDTGKRILKLVPQRVDSNWSSIESRHGIDNVFRLPCGKCEACKLAKMRDWATRCELESQYHSETCFLTLTYDNFHYFPALKTFKHDLKKFRARMCKAGFHFKDFTCCEQGEHTGRWHFHMICFGYCPHDQKYYSKSKSGEYLYTSAELNKLWKYGQVYVGEFSYSVGAYIAGYCAKKLKGDNPLEFLSMSPGLGKQYLLDHKEELLKYGSIQMKNGYTAPIPHYFVKLLEDEGLINNDFHIKNSDKYRALENAEMLELNICQREELFNYRSQKYKDKLFRKKRGL